MEAVAALRSRRHAGRRELLGPGAAAVGADEEADRVRGAKGSFHEAYRTCTPAGLGGDVGGAMSTTTLPMPPAPTAAATAGVLALSTCTQFWPPSVDVKTPCPTPAKSTRPACSTRLPAGVEVSSTSERTSPAMPAPGVQFRPPFCERNTPLVDAR